MLFGQIRSAGLFALLAAIAVVTTPWADEVRDHLTREVKTEHDDAAQAATARDGEVLHLEWKLGGFLGVLAGLFVPSSGKALLTFVPTAEERTEIGLLVTAPKREGEYMLYGASIEERSGSLASVWSCSEFRGKYEAREQDIEGEKIIDYSSVIWLLRWHPPDTPTRMTIWSEGKVYPAEIEPLGPSRRKIRGKKIDVRGYLVRGAKVDGKRSFDDSIFVYYAQDANATPVEIVGKRSLIHVRIRLVESDGNARAPRGATVVDQGTSKSQS